MDFDDEMSGLQIEDLGEYFLQADIGDSWKGFSLGYVEEEKAAPSSQQPQQSQQQQQQSQQQQQQQQQSSHAALSQAMRFNSTASTSASAPIAIPNAAANQSSQQQQYTSPPMSSFSELLKHGGNAFSLNSPRQDFSFSPALFASAANLLKADLGTGGDGKMSAADHMDLSNFSLDALKKIPQLQQPPIQQQPQQQPQQQRTPKSTDFATPKDADACLPEYPGRQRKNKRGDQKHGSRAFVDV
ncbi:hypothetical protein FI667_g10073, partial [Globisporangium splendens]